MEQYELITTISLVWLTDTEIQLGGCHSTHTVLYTQMSMSISVCVCICVRVCVSECMFAILVEHHLEMFARVYQCQICRSAVTSSGRDLLTTPLWQWARS